MINRLKLLGLATAVCSFTYTASAVPPEYKVTGVSDPPSSHDSSQIDGLTFLPDGRLVVTLPSGEIFFYDIEKDHWHLFAEGLHNPLGVYAESNSTLVVMQRPELTRVQDTDGDGKADLFAKMTDAFGMSGNYHEFAFTPVRDSDGNYFFALGTGSSGAGIRAIVRGQFEPRGRPGRMHASTPYRGWVMKYSPDGKTTPVSSGHRTPNGLGFDLKGNLFVTDNQGDWVGSSKLFHVKKGRFYGHAASLAWRDDFEGTPIETSAEKLDSLRTRAAVVFPHGSMANSPTKVLAISEGANLGPFTGQLLVGEMNKPRIVRVMLEEVGGELQGACIPFIDGPPMRTGVNRMAFAPDGSLYVGHTKHTWAGNSGITRVEYSGETPFEVQSMNLTENGFRFTFTRPIDPETAKASAFPFKRYYYEYHQSYGASQDDLTELEVASVNVSKDNLTVEVELKELVPWHIHEVKLSGIQSADGADLGNNYLAYTLNRLLGETPPSPAQWGESKSKKPKPTKIVEASPVKVEDFAGSIFEAEEAQMSSVARQNKWKGYTGKGYADYSGDKGASVTWKISIKEGGKKDLHFRYALQGGERPLRLIIDDKEIDTLPFEGTKGWQEWKDESIAVDLKQGEHTIRLESIGKNGGNIDHLRIDNA
ncbi:MAG: carbohydrate-binding protein [Verrucomicrobiota bacterium]